MPNDLRAITYTRAQQVEQAVAHIQLAPGFIIRPWFETDYPAVRDLAAAEGWTTLRDRPSDGLRAWQNAWPALVVLRQRVIVGFLRALTDGAVTLYVADLLVAPMWRGQGIGAALLEVCHALYLSVRLDLLSTQNAEAFYQRNGFRAFRGFRKSYA